MITDIHEQVQQIPWLLTRFVQQTSGVTDAVCVSSDGLLMAMSTDLDRGRADQFARGEYVRADGQAWVFGPAVGTKWKEWMGIKWKMQTGLPGAGTASAKGWIWHKNAVGYAATLSFIRGRAENLTRAIRGE